MPNVVTNVEPVRKFIRKQIEAKYGTITAYAEKEEVTLQYVSNVLSGHKAVPDWMLKRFKVQHQVEERWIIPG